MTKRKVINSLSELPINIQLKNIKYVAANSTDSHCYSATVYVDGTRFGLICDNGMGGDTEIDPLDRSVDSKAFRSECKSLNDVLDGYTLSDKQQYDFGESIEFIACERVNEFLMEREFRKMIKKIAYYDGKDVYSMPVKMKPTPKNIEIIKTTPWWEERFVLLNDMSVEEGAKFIRKHRL